MDIDIIFLNYTLALKNATAVNVGPPDPETDATPVQVFFAEEDIPEALARAQRGRADRWLERAGITSDSNSVTITFDVGADRLVTKLTRYR